MNKNVCKIVNWKLLAKLSGAMMCKSSAAAAKILKRLSNQT